MTVPAQSSSERSSVEAAFPLRSPHVGNTEGRGGTHRERRGTPRLKIRNVPLEAWLERVRWAMFLLALGMTAYVFLF